MKIFCYHCSLMSSSNKETEPNKEDPTRCSVCNASYLDDEELSNCSFGNSFRTGTMGYKRFRVM